MTEIILTCCDYCNLEYNEHPHDGRGVAVADTEICVREFEWIKTSKGVQCLQCQEEGEAE